MSKVSIPLIKHFSILYIFSKSLHLYPSFFSSFFFSYSFFPTFSSSFFPPSSLGMARGVVIATGDRTVLGRIANLAARMEIGSEPLICQELNHMIFTISVLAGIISVLFFFIGGLACWIEWEFRSHADVKKKVKLKM